MKNNTMPYVFLLFALLAFLLVQCKKESLKLAPTVTLSTVTNVGSDWAIIGGDVTSDGGSYVISKGICWDKVQNPTILGNMTNNGPGTGSFSSLITKLTPGSTYYIRAFATNYVETAYSNQATFTTVALPLDTFITNRIVPALTTTVASAIAYTTVTIGGNVTSEGGSAVTKRGVCWATTQNPSTRNSTYNSSTASTGIFTIHVTGLKENTTYYFRAFAINSKGTGYGNEVCLKTLGGTDPIIFNPSLTYGTVTDIDGNVYKTITIGTQTWMADNLKTTKYRNGDPIPNVTGTSNWATLATGAYCWYNDDTTYKANFGALYNWFAVAGSRNIAPSGWHVPTDADWTTLITYLGGVTVAGDKMRETGTLHWLSPNTYATNSSGFTALPGGMRGYDGIFEEFGRYGYWWSSTATEGYPRNLVRSIHQTLNLSYFYLFYPQQSASIRCIQD